MVSENVVELTEKDVMEMYVTIHQLTGEFMEFMKEHDGEYLTAKAFFPFFSIMDNGKKDGVDIALKEALYYYLLCQTVVADNSKPFENIKDTLEQLLNTINEFDYKEIHDETNA